MNDLNSICVNLYIKIYKQFNVYRYKKAERKIENEAEELVSLWNLRIRTLTKLKSVVGALRTSPSYIEHSKMFYDDENWRRQKFLLLQFSRRRDMGKKVSINTDEHKTEIMIVGKNTDKEAE